MSYHSSCSFQENLSTESSEAGSEGVFTTKTAQEMRQSISDYTKKTEEVIRRYQEACRRRDELRSLKLSFKQAKDPLPVFRNDRTDPLQELSSLKNDLMILKDRLHKCRYAEAVTENENKILKARLENQLASQSETTCKCQIF